MRASTIGIARGLSMPAVSRAAAPDTEVPLAVKEGLRANGFDLSGFVPTSLNASDVRGAMLVASFDQDVSVQRVEKLVDELARRVPP
jgi:hypothetical protein